MNYIRRNEFESMMHICGKKKSFYSSLQRKHTAQSALVPYKSLITGR